jgi:hypothetical protein
MESCKTCLYKEECSNDLQLGTDVCSEHSSFMEMTEEQIEESKLVYPYIWGD